MGDRKIRQPVGRGQGQARIQRPVEKKRTREKKNKIIVKPARLLLVMACVCVCTFILTAFATGNFHRVTRIVEGVLLPGMPKLVIRDTQRELKVNPLSRTNAQEMQVFLSRNYEDNQGIPMINSESIAAGTFNQTPIQRQMAKIGFSPQTLSVTKEQSQKITFPVPPTHMEAYIFFYDDVRVSYSLDEINNYLPDKDGMCYVLVDATWEADRKWQRGKSGMYCFAVNFDRPAVFSISAEDIDPGELLVFYAEYLSQGEAVTVQSSLPLNLQFSPYGSRQMIALSPIKYDILPGTYATTLSVANGSQSFNITVKDKEFAVQYVSIDPQVVAETRTEETNKEFLDKINPILTEQLPELLWEGKATLPVPESRVLTLFGSRRYVNDDVNSYRHTGLDLEAPIGAEVRAVNRGKVLFAEYLAYTGNTVLIEHGLGLKSWYYHMDDILVSPGDVVYKNDVIGTSGQTGFAGEPHLHLNLSVGATYINPVTAFNQTLFNDPL